MSKYVSILNVKNISQMIQKLQKGFLNIFQPYEIKKYIKLYKNEIFNFHYQSTNQLYDMLDELEQHILNDPHASNFDMHIRRELLTRGKMPFQTGFDETTWLLRWWYLRQPNNSAYESILRVFKDIMVNGEFVNDSIDPDLNRRYLFELLTDKNLSKSEWSEVLQDLTKYEIYLYPDENRNYRRHMSSVWTGLMAGEAVLFTDSDVKDEYVLNFCYALLYKVRYELNENKNIEEIVGPNLFNELKAIQKHAYQNDYQSYEIKRVCDFLIKEKSPLRAVYHQMDCKDNLEILFKDSAINYQEGATRFPRREINF